MLEVLEMVVKESMCMVIRSIEPVEIRRIAQDFIPPPAFNFRHRCGSLASSRNISICFVLLDCHCLNSNLSHDQFITWRFYC